MLASVVVHCERECRVFFVLCCREVLFYVVCVSWWYNVRCGVHLWCLKKRNAREYKHQKGLCPENCK
jgi:hypothetical protein